MARKKKGTTPALDTNGIIDGDELVSERDLYKRLAIEAHAEREADRLRAGLLAWFAKLMQEISYIEGEIADENSDLFRALGADEANDVRVDLDAVWCVVAKSLPRCQPAFLAPSITIPAEAAK